MGLTVWLRSVLPRFTAWPVTAFSAKPPVPVAVSLKFVFRILAAAPFGNSRLEIQYTPVMVWLVRLRAGAGIATSMSKMVAPASVDDATSAPAPRRAFILKPARIGLDRVVKPPGLTVYVPDRESAAA